MAVLVIVKSLDVHTRGRIVAGASRAYYVDPETSYLHEVVGSAPVNQPGCHPEDAQDFLSVPVYKRVRVAAPPAPRAIVVKAPTPVPPPDLSILDLSVSKLRKALDTGEHDTQLQDLLDAEKAGKTRKGAVSALKERLTTSGA